MKGEYVKEEKDHPSNMFAAKLHQTRKVQHHPQPYQEPTTFHRHQQQSFQVANPRECQTSDEVDSHRSPNAPSLTPIKRDPPTQTVHLAGASSGNDGATIEVVRRPRGRPPGSKNKPKPPVVITRDAEPSMSPYILEIPGGFDIVESVTGFCRIRNMGLCVLNGTGTVSNVTLRQPSTTPGASVTFHGRFDILSLSATVIPSNTHASSVELNNDVANGFTISLAGPQGQVVGGAVMGSLFSAGTVYLIAGSFNNPSFHRLPMEDERNSESAGGGNDCRHPSSPAVSGGGDCGRSPPTPAAAAAAAESCGVSLYSCHLPSDVIWAPTARQPTQNPPPY